MPAPTPDRRPRLLLLTADYPPDPGGVQLLAQRLVQQMDAFDTRVATLRARSGGHLDAAQEAPVLRVPAPGGSGLARAAALNAASLAQAVRHRPEVTLAVHLLASPAAALVQRATGAPTVQYFHAKEVGDKPRLAAFAARRARVVIAVSRYSAELVRATGAEPRRLELIPPGVDLPPSPPGPRDEVPTMLTVSRLRDAYKGHDVLIRGLARVRAAVPSLQWIVIGEGELRPRLEALAREEGVADAIRFLGAVSDEERDRWLARAWLLAMPSRLPEGGGAGEGFGIVYLEAGARGRPVVAGNVGGALDAVLDGETGLLVDPADPVAVADAVIRLLTDPELAARLGANAVAHARRLAWPQTAARVQGLLLEVLAERARPGGR